ncbi:MAG TPA: hypothetical protein VNS46_21710 [Nocardioides sp.]|nr:hypothetical protein [Nocardioides sp.]
MVNTPGPLGYVLAWLTSVLSLGVMLVPPHPLQPEPLLASAATALALVPLSAPFAAAGILLVEHTCGGAPEQWRHVLAATAAGAMAGGLLTLVSVGLVVLIPMIAASTALGRTVVIPLVWHRRRRHVVAG